MSLLEILYKSMPFLKINNEFYLLDTFNSNRIEYSVTIRGCGLVRHGDGLQRKSPESVI